MSNVISKLGTYRIFLISIILLCGVFASENAFSFIYWKKNNMRIYNHYDKFITFDFLVYDYYFTHFTQHDYLKSCEFEYSEDGDNYTHLMSLSIKKQENKNRTLIMLQDKKTDEKIQILNCVKPKSDKMWPNNGKDLKVEVNITKTQHLEQGNVLTTQRSYMSVKWHLPPSCKHVKNIRIKGIWVINIVHCTENIFEVYTPENVKSGSNTLKNTPSVLKSEISDNVKVSKVVDAIIVSGAEPGENIKVYTISGAEVKSAVANDDVVSIKLPKNQIYIVNIGQARYKVAL